MHGLLLAASLLSLPFHAAGDAPQSNGLVRRGVDLNSYRLLERSSYVNSNDLQRTAAVATLGPKTYVAIATGFVKLIVPDATFRLVDDHHVSSSGVAHVYFRQTMSGVDIDNADFNVNVGKNGEVLSYGNSFHVGKPPASNPRSMLAKSDPVKALRGACETLSLPIDTAKATTQAGNDGEVVFKGTSGALSEPKGKMVYLMKQDGSLALTWRVETDVTENWLLSYVDVEDPKKIYNVVDYVAHATYQVYPWGLNDPTEGERIIISDPWDLQTSEFTWIGNGMQNYTTTLGNNAIAQSNPSGRPEYLNNFRPQSPTLNFQWEYSPSMSPPSTYTNASITQLFYTANTYHDLLYTLGFTEKSGNFETNNNGQGGKGNDYVILNSQDGAGTNNANFATPPDGQPGRMRMYIWTRATPPRDGCFEAGVVIHEYTHGLSNRLTGGPANSRCLNGLESGGMGEGWSDLYATAVRLKPKDNRDTVYPKSAWAFNNPRGNRAYPYSTSFDVNPLVYTSVNSLNEVHAVGTVWATMLYEVMWNLIDKHGKNDAPKPTFRNGIPTDGKYLMMKFLLDGMAFQPCNPNFVQARDAILDADKALTGGKNKCEIWKGFAKRELGTGAKYDPRNRVGSKEVPRECR